MSPNVDAIQEPAVGSPSNGQRLSGKQMNSTAFRRKRIYRYPHCSRIARVSDEFLVTCPYCGEQVEIYVEPDVNGTFVQDCEVCCNPWRVKVSGRDEDRAVNVTRADGSE